MRRTGKIGLVAALLLAAASSLPEQASSQVPDVFDVRNSGFAPASQPFDTRDVLVTHSTGWVAAHGMPGAYVPCSGYGPSPFGYNPGMFQYGYYMSPFDTRFSRFWRTPIPHWYGYPGFGYPGYGYSGFGYGLYWPASSGRCGSGYSSYRGYRGFGFGFGYAGSSWGYGPGVGFGSSYWGYSGFGGGFGVGYPGYPTGSAWSNSGWGNSGWGPGTYSGPRGTNGGLGLDTGSGYVPPSVRDTKGFRVIESRPTTGGADLRRTEPSRLDRWFEQFAADAGGARSATPTSRDPIGDAQARGLAYERSSRESISELIARARAATEGAAVTQESRPSGESATPARRVPRAGTESPTRAEPKTRTAAPSRTPVRKTPSTRARSEPRIPSASAPRSASTAAPRATPRAVPRSTSRPAPKPSSKSSRRTSGKSPQ